MKCEKKFVKVSKGLELHSKICESGKPIWLIHTHGLGEHLGRHKFIEDLFGHHFNLMMYDLRGHGASQGRSAHVDNFYYYMEDLRDLIEYLKIKYKMERYVLTGHSMGGLIVSGFLQSYVKAENYPERVFLSSPPVGIGGVLGKLVKYTPTGLWRSLAETGLTCELGGMVDNDALSHDPRVAESYNNDPLVNSKLHVKLLLELVRASKEVFSRPINPLCPIAAAIGGQDQVVSANAFLNYFENIEKKVEYKVFNDGFHELHNEIQKYREPFLDYFKAQMLETLYQ